MTSTAIIWFNIAPGLAGKSYYFLSGALRRQFHTETDVWLLRQKLHDRKQLPTDSVSEFAANIRRLCQRIGLPNTERVTMFIQNLRPDLKHYVLLQRPESLEAAEMHACMKESLPEPKIVDRTDEILSALSKLQNAQTTTPRTPTVGSYGPHTQKPDHVPRASRENQPITRDEITQVIRQELRRRNQNRSFNPNQRGRKTNDGKVICDWCSKPGHVMAVCRKRLSQRRFRLDHIKIHKPGDSAQGSVLIQITLLLHSL